MTTENSHKYRARKYGLYGVWWNLFLRAKQQQEQISPNHVQAIFSGSVHILKEVVQQSVSKYNKTEILKHLKTAFGTCGAEIDM